MTRYLRALPVVFLLAVAPAFPQNGSLRGELRDSPGPTDKFNIRLTSIDHSATTLSAFVGVNGAFQFSSIPQGTYRLEVQNFSGELIKQEIITVTGPATEANVSLASTRAHPILPAGAATVSLNQLRHDPNGKAAQEFSLGASLLLKQDLRNARKHLSKALQADPDFAEAHLELGTAAFRLGELDTAKLEFQRAVELDPNLSLGWGNLASMLFQAKAYDQAEAAASHGLAVFPGDAKLHFIAGASRMARGDVNPEITAHLEKASKSYPNAHLLLAEALLRLGQFKNVRAHLEASMVSPSEGVRARAQYLMSHLGP